MQPLELYFEIVFLTHHLPAASILYLTGFLINTPCSTQTNNLQGIYKQFPSAKSLDVECEVIFP